MYKSYIFDEEKQRYNQEELDSILEQKRELLSAKNQ